MHYRFRFFNIAGRHTLHQPFRQGRTLDAVTFILPKQTTPIWSPGYIPLDQVLLSPEDDEPIETATGCNGKWHAAW
jgi:hypothetical protein